MTPMSAERTAVPRMRPAAARLMTARARRERHADGRTAARPPPACRRMAATMERGIRGTVIDPRRGRQLFDGYRVDAIAARRAYTVSPDAMARQPSPKTSRSGNVVAVFGSVLAVRLAAARVDN